MTALAHDEKALYVALERVALAIRYLAYLFCVLLFLAGRFPFGSAGIVLVTAVVGCHNVFAHWALLSRREGLFASWVNFVIYYLESCFAVVIAGPESGDVFVVFHVVLIGYGVHSPRFRKVALAAGLFAASYALLVYWAYAETGLARPVQIVAFQAASILASGWIIASLSAWRRRLSHEWLTKTLTLAASEATLHTVLDAAADAILVFDDREIIVDANEQASRFLKVGREELLGRRIRAFLFDDGTLPNKFAALRVRGVVRGEEIVVDGDGEEHTVAITIQSFIRNERTHYVGVLRDLTDQKEFQEATRAANQNLDRLNRELRQVNDLKTGFMNAVSRRLRSPLAAVLGHLEMLLNEELGNITQDQRKALYACRRATLRSFRVIDEAVVPPKQRAERDPGEDAAPTDQAG